MKRGVSFLLQNMTMLTDNYNLLRPVDKQRREKKRKIKRAIYNLLSGPILAAFFIFNNYSTRARWISNDR